MGPKTILQGSYTMNKENTHGNLHIFFFIIVKYNCFYSDVSKNTRLRAVFTDKKWGARTHIYSFSPLSTLPFMQFLSFLGLFLLFFLFFSLFLFPLLLIIPFFSSSLCHLSHFLSYNSSAKLGWTRYKSPLLPLLLFTSNTLPSFLIASHFSKMLCRLLSSGHCPFAIAIPLRNDVGG